MIGVEMSGVCQQNKLIGENVSGMISSVIVYVLPCSFSVYRFDVVTRVLELLFSEAQFWHHTHILAQSTSHLLDKQGWI
jgi:hypothetical protein